MMALRLCRVVAACDDRLAQCCARMRASTARYDAGGRDGVA